MKHQAVLKKDAMDDSVNSQRFIELDSLRGIAAILVIFFHYTSTVRLILPDLNFGKFDFRWGDLGVSLFFLISGYVILMSAMGKTTIKRFSLNRLLRLYPTYCVCLLITVILIYGTGFSRLYRPLWEIIINFSMIQSFVGVRDFDGVYWSLSREMVFYILLAATLIITRNKIPPKLAIYASTLWSFTGFCLINIFGSLQTNIGNLIIAASVSQFAPLFAVGMLQYLRRTTVYVSATWIAVNVFFATYNEYVMHGIEKSILLLIVILLFCVICYRKDTSILRNKMLLGFGSISYPLYLLHQNIGYMIIAYSYQLLGSFGSRIFAIGVVIFLAILVHELVEKRLTSYIKKIIIR
ncbi:MAG: acyltransferase [Rothia sp. (in: high G+C Gram-positive bacteria)]|nr:acyltransferase [Rothia sp. (in: high G+C Gram-positive bacteria)]